MQASVICGYCCVHTPHLRGKPARAHVASLTMDGTLCESLLAYCRGSTSAPCFIQLRDGDGWEDTIWRLLLELAQREQGFVLQLLLSKESEESSSDAFTRPIPALDCYPYPEKKLLERVQLGWYSGPEDHIRKFLAFLKNETTPTKRIVFVEASVSLLCEALPSCSDPCAMVLLCSHNVMSTIDHNVLFVWFCRDIPQPGKAATFLKRYFTVISQGQDWSLWAYSHR